MAVKRLTKREQLLIVIALEWLLDIFAENGEDTAEIAALLRRFPS